MEIKEDIGERKKVLRPVGMEAIGMAEMGATGVVGMGAVGIAVSAIVLGSSGISLAKGMNIQDNQRIA